MPNPFMCQLINTLKIVITVYQGQLQVTTIQMLPSWDSCSTCPVDTLETQVSSELRYQILEMKNLSR